MKASFISKLRKLYERFEEIQILLGEKNTITNQKKFIQLSREYSQLKDITSYFLEWKKILIDIAEVEKMLTIPEFENIAQQEIKILKRKHDVVEEKIKLLLLPKEKENEKNVYLEIRAGTGGNEAALFASELFRMYLRYSEKCRWHLKIISSSPCEYGGYKEIIAKISGSCVYGRLRFESGGHRVQRVPTNESQGRIHTSSCTVAVMPEVPNLEIPNIIPTDIRIDTFRSSGAGGQHVNTTDSAIRITHFPTGIVVECQDERSQHKNKARAFSVLYARIKAHEISKKKEQEAVNRRSLLGSGMRSDRNRTYSFPQNRITDHRINLTVYSLNEIMSGELDKLIEPVIQEYRAARLADYLK